MIIITIDYQASNVA